MDSILDCVNETKEQIEFNNNNKNNITLYYQPYLCGVSKFTLSKEDAEILIMAIVTEFVEERCDDYYGKDTYRELVKLIDLLGQHPDLEGHYYEFCDHEQLYYNWDYFPYKYHYYSWHDYLRHEGSRRWHDVEKLREIKEKIPDDFDNLFYYPYDILRTKE
eukprot:gene11567-4813_t